MEVIQRGPSEKEPEQSPSIEPTVARGRRGMVILGDDANIEDARPLHVARVEEAEGVWQVHHGGSVEYSHLPGRP